MKNNSSEQKSTEHLYSGFDKHKGGVSDTHETADDPKAHRSAYSPDTEKKYDFFKRGK